MMIVVANLRLSGFFALANAWVTAWARRPATLLAAVVLVSAVFSAFLVNDAICLVLAPLVVDVAKGARRNPVPYLLAVALDHDRLRLHAISALDHGLSLCLRG